MSAADTAPASRLEYIAPAPDMAGIIHTLFVMRVGEGRVEDVMPSYSAQFFSFVEGSGEVRFPDRPVGRSTDFTLNAPMLRAAPMVLEGPVLNVGASFTPLGWAAFSGLAADEVHDTSLCATTIFDDAALAPLRLGIAQCRAGEIEAQDYARAIEDFIRATCRSARNGPRPEHVELVAAIDRWLASEFNPPIERLYGSVPLGQRQVQRLCKRYFGVPPAQLVKRFRAIRAAMLLAHEDLSDELRNEVLGAYFDQAHLIHDIRRYTGRTPKVLAQEPLAQNMLDPEGHGATAHDLRNS